MPKGTARIRAQREPSRFTGGHRYGIPETPEGSLHALFERLKTPRLRRATRERLKVELRAAICEKQPSIAAWGAAGALELEGKVRWKFVSRIAV